jgi:hypothetical protein
VNVAHPNRLLLAAVAALLVQLPPGKALAADPPPSNSAGTTVVGEYQTTDSTTVIVVERKPLKPWETPAWAYPERGLTFFPDGPGKGNDRWAIGGLWQIAPMFTAQYTRGLGSGFSVDAQLQTIILFNELGVGGQWAFRWGPFSFAPMVHLNGYFGALGKAVIETTSFNTTGWGILLNPGAKAGLQVAKDAWITLQFEAYVNLYQAVNLGGMVLSPKSVVYDGFGLTAIVEYAPNKHGGVFYYGASLYNTAANYPIFFNVEATPSSESFSGSKIVYLGVMAGYEF